MLKKIIKLMAGSTLASFGVVCVINAGLGCFSITAANAALANWTGLTIGIAGMIVELIMLAIATWQGEGLGIASVVNATYGSIMVDVFIPILPVSPYMILGVFLLPIAWAMMGSVGLGENGSNTLMNAILKKTKFNISTIRSVQEVLFLIIGFLGARNFVTPFTFVLVFGLGPLIQITYKLIKFEPTKVKHQYFIKLSTDNKLFTAFKK